MCVLPYADIVLISTNSITAIAYNTFLSIHCLGEKFLCKYDLPAFSLMGVGAITIILLSKTVQTEMSRDSIIELFTSK